MSGGSLPSADSVFRHEALFYNSPQAYLDVAVPFVREGLRADEAVVAAVPDDKAAALREALGPDDAVRVSFEPVEILGRNPSRLIGLWSELARGSRNESTGARGIAEPGWAGRSSAALTECFRHEARLNLAFKDASAFHLLCAFETSVLRTTEREHAERHHSHLVENGTTSESATFEHASTALDWILQETLDPPPDGAVVLDFDGESLRDVRQTAERHAQGLGMSPGRIAELKLAVDEIATNSVVHAPGPRTFRLWDDDGDLVCEVQDHGHIDDHLVGSTRPPLDAPSGRGLFIVNQLCDLVQIRSAPSGTSVRIRMEIDPSPGSEPSRPG